MVVGDGCCSHTLDANGVGGYIYIYIYIYIHTCCCPLSVAKLVDTGGGDLADTGGGDLLESKLA